MFCGNDGYYFPNLLTYRAMVFYPIQQNLQLPVSVWISLPVRTVCCRSIPHILPFIYKVVCQDGSTSFSI